MKITRSRAFVLTAGYGSRLRPLTLFLPKPLLPICGEAVAGHTLSQLARLGCECAVLNLHHMGHAISDHFGSNYRGLELYYSKEEEIQGTLGALYPIREFLADCELVMLVNGDSLCDWPWKNMIRQHLKSGAEATLLLNRRPPKSSQGGPVGVDARGAVVQLRDSEPIGEVAKRHLFMGAHILAPQLLKEILEGPGDIVGDLYIPLLQEKRLIQGVVTGRRWHDLGTPERYLTASMDWTRSLSLPGFRPNSVISPEAQVSEDATIHRAVIEARVIVQAEARVEESVILSAATVPSGCTVRKSIIGPGVALPAAASIEHRMVTRIRSGDPPGPKDTVMGDLVYTPLEKN